MLSCPLPGSCLLMPMLTQRMGSKAQDEVGFLMSEKRGTSLEDNEGRKDLEEKHQNNKTKPADGISCNSLFFCPSICWAKEGLSSTNKLVSQTEEPF